MRILTTRGPLAMRRSTLLAAAIALTCLGTHLFEGTAAERRGESARHANCCATSCCCPDNYCKKPMPCIACPNWCGCPDDYCKKPMPCIACPSSCGCPDDYCKKPFPNLCLTRDWQFFRCPPCEGQYAAGAKASPQAAQPKPTPAPPKPQPKPLPKVY